MNYKHTPGPWITIEGDMREFEITTAARVGVGQVSICEIDTDFDGQIGEEQVANARLIIAAPTLLAHLKFAVDLLGAMPLISGTAQVEAMRAAIAKATGAA